MPTPVATTPQAGFASSSSYDQHRPSFPPTIVSSLLEHMNLTNALNAKIIDLGAGTGKFTQLLSAREEDFQILAVEPHGEMRAELVRKGLKGVKVLEGGVGDLGELIGNEKVEGVITAQAFHWFATDEALQQIHRVLVPGGTLGLIWNIEDYNAPESWTPTTEWESKLKAIIWSFADDSPRFRHEEWQKVFDDQLKSTPVTIQAADPLFSLPLGHESEKFTYWLSKEAIWARFHTLSHIAVLEGEKLQDTKRKAFEAMDGEGVEANEKGELPLHGHTVAYWTTAIPGAPLRNGG